MLLTAFGNQGRSGLDHIAKNVYNLLPEEYDIVQDWDNDGEYALNIKTLRRIDPIIKASISRDRARAEISIYPGINSNKVFSDKDIVMILRDRWRFAYPCIKKRVLAEFASHYRRGMIVEKIPVVEGQPVVNGKDAIVRILFERPSQQPTLLSNGNVDYKNFTNFIIVKEGDLLIKRTPPTAGTKGFDVTGEDINPLPGKDRIIVAVEGVDVDEEKTEYRARYGGHVVFTGNAISVLPLLYIGGNVDYGTGNINFDGTVRIAKDVLAGFCVSADDIIIEGINENAMLIASNSINIKVGIKGMKTGGSKGYVKAGTDVVTGYSENSRISAKGSIEIKKYCFNSILSANRIFTSSKTAIVAGGVLRAFSIIHLHNAGTKGTNDMLLEVGTSQDTEDRTAMIRAELLQQGETLKKIMSALAQMDLKNPAVLNNPKVRQLLDTANMLKRKQPLLKAKLEETKKKATYPDPRIIIENKARAGIKIKIFDVQMELQTDMMNVEFYFDWEKEDIAYHPYFT